jgi:hypothetical protein
MKFGLSSFVQFIVDAELIVLPAADPRPLIATADHPG